MLALTTESHLKCSAGKYRGSTFWWNYYTHVWSRLCCSCALQGERNGTIHAQVGVGGGGGYKSISTLPGPCIGERGTTGRRTAPPTSRRHVIYTQPTPNCITLGSASTLLRVQCELTGVLAAGAPSGQSGKRRKRRRRRKSLNAAGPSWSQLERLWSGAASLLWQLDGQLTWAAQSCQSSRSWK